jgi:hypothetical protein
LVKNSRIAARPVTAGASGGKSTASSAYSALSAPCYECHRAHGAVDTTFAQFYPIAKAIAIKAGTYRE